ncbi:unnamed protein product [Alternaria alternata]
MTRNYNSKAQAARGIIKTDDDDRVFDSVVPESDKYAVDWLLFQKLLELWVQEQ